MGVFYSYAPPPSPPPPPFVEPWLHTDWGSREADLEFINSYRPEAGGQQQFRILLHGPVGAGKSSFINSVMSALEGRICRRASACNVGQGSFTKEYTTYTIKKGNRGDIYPLVLNDMAGLSIINRRHRRVHVKDVKQAMKGHISDGYTFNPERSLSKTDSLYNRKPTINDKVHILVSVIDADTANRLGNNVVERMPLSLVQEFSKLVGIPENCIFPVKNYHSERELVNDIDTLILNTLKRIIEIGEEYQRH